MTIHSSNIVVIMNNDNNHDDDDFVVASRLCISVNANYSSIFVLVPVLRV